MRNKRILHSHSCRRANKSPKKTLMNKIFTLIVSLLCVMFSFSQNIQLDNTFNPSGVLPGSILENINPVDSATTLIVQNDGKIIVAGNSNLNKITLVRYKIDGSKDGTFGNGGISTTTVGTYCNVRSIVLQGDGKIVVAGYAGDQNGDLNLLVLRFLPTGILDATFNLTGVWQYDISDIDIINGVAIDKDSAIVFVGEANSQVLVGKINASGEWTNFGTALGYLLIDIPDTVNETVNAIAIREVDSAILFAGTVGDLDKDFLLGCYNRSGLPLQNFGANGIVRTNISSEDIANCIITSGENILVGGSSIQAFNRDFSIVRYSSAGVIDNSFGTNGITTTNISSDSDDIPYSIDLQKDGDILLGGSSLSGSTVSHAVVRYTSNGTIDSNFDNDGKVTINIGKDIYPSSMKLSSYRIYLAGTSQTQDFSIIALQNSELALPIQLKSFLAVNNGNTVNLTWTSSSEINAALFEIERSIDGKRYARLGQVAAKGNSNTFNIYHFTDIKPSTVNHYRLKMVDLDGKASYSHIIMVRGSGAAKFEISPNPVHSTFQVTIDDPSVSVLRVYSSSGIPLQVINLPPSKGKRTIPVNAGNLVPGIYFIKGGEHTGSFTKI